MVSMVIDSILERGLRAMDKWMDFAIVKADCWDKIVNVDIKKIQKTNYTQTWFEFDYNRKFVSACVWPRVSMKQF